MEDALEVYEEAYNPQEPVVCLDEKPIVLHGDTPPSQKVEPRQPAMQDYEYQRCGTANVICAVEPKAGRHVTWACPLGQPIFADMLHKLAEAYTHARSINLVLDHLSAHALASLVRRFGQQHGAAL